MYALTLNTEILNQKGVPTRQIITKGEHPPVYGEGFYSVGDVLIRSEHIMAIVKMDIEIEPIADADLTPDEFGKMRASREDDSGLFVPYPIEGSYDA